MSISDVAGAHSARVRFVVLTIFLVLCLIGGGASRHDVVSLLYLRPATLFAVAALLILPGGIDWRAVRVPLMFLAALALIILAQLVPLPPDLWRSLPGHERYAEAAAAAGFAEPWRPITLTPDLSLNSLLALMPPAAMLVGFASIQSEQRRWLVVVLIAAAFLSAVIGVFQLGGNPNSPVYLYEVTNRGWPVGFFSNRNHQAFFLALTFPVLRVWTLMPHEDRLYRRRRFWGAVGVGLFLIPLILVTGSRAGLFLGMLGLAAAFLIAPRRRLKKAGSLSAWAIRGTLVAIPAALVVTVILFGRAFALDRLLAAADLNNELRVRHAAVMVDMVRDFFPFGSGFGSFDSVFRGYEPSEALSPFYFNHAHNDLLELAITGGLPALALLAAFLLWWVMRSLAVWRTTTPLSRETLFARLGSSMLAILLIASVVDYPLRTPLMAVVFSIACGWLSQWSSRGAGPDGRERSGQSRELLYGSSSRL